MSDKNEKSNEKGLLARTALYTSKKARRAQTKVCLLTDFFFWGEGGGGGEWTKIFHVGVLFVLFGSKNRKYLFRFTFLCVTF